MWGASAPHTPQVNKPSYRGPAAPGPPAIYPSNPQKHFQRHGNGVLIAERHLNANVFLTSPNKSTVECSVD